MQEIHLIGGGGFFGSGEDRRLKPHQNHQALKCPRCDSLNTKFCYYNNYNLSQPRHFCKSCRRYWTKGGVLRNVPVGGGCRKSKRSRPKNPSSQTTATAAPTAPLQLAEQELKSNSHSSSESSGATATAATTEAVSAPSSNSKAGIQESKLLLNQSTNSGFENRVLEQGGDCSIFSDTGNFTSFVYTTNEALPFEFGNISDASLFRFNAQQGYDPVLQSQWQHQTKVMNRSDNQELKLPEIAGGSGSDQTVLVDFSSLQSKGSSGGFESLDWHGIADQGLFDLPSTVDHAYWGQSQWTDQDNHNLYLP